MRTWQKLGLFAGVAAAAGAVTAQPAQKVTGPIETYWVSAQTQSGFGMGGMGGGGRPSMSQIMGMMNGQGQAQHSLMLQLGSSQKAQGEPDAAHAPPAGLAVGPSLPLVTPKPPPPGQKVEEEAPPPVPREYQKPKGRMLIFWGCGEHAKPGQPIVIDFAEMSAGKVPPGMAMLGKGLGFTPMQPPSVHRNTTYGEWPNEKGRTSVTPQSSLVGDHMVHGNYGPDIRFSLTQAQDFLGPLSLTTNAKLPSGGVQLGWAPVSGAEAYLASVIGGGQNDTVVLWSSSETQAAAFIMPDYLRPADLNRGVETHALMGAQTTSCAVPKEVLDAAPQGLVQMVAYGGEANFVYPPRPADPKVTWNQQWTVKVRYRSSTGGMLGMAMPGAGGRRGGYGDSSQGGQAQQPDAQPQTPEDAKAARRKAILKGLGGALGLPH